jgi:hypothetical protein
MTAGRFRHKSSPLIAASMLVMMALAMPLQAQDVSKDAVTSLKAYAAYKAGITKKRKGFGRGWRIRGIPRR